MTKRQQKNEDRFGWGLAGKVFLLLTAVSLVGCVAAIPAVIYYEKSHKGFAVTAQLKVKANDIYKAALEIIEENTDMKLVKKDPEELEIHLEAKHEDGIHKVMIKATPIDNGKRSQLLAVADIPSNRKADQTWALYAVKTLCEKLGVEYTLVKG